MKILPNSSFGAVVKLNFKTVSLFQINSIDYCICGNKLSQKLADKQVLIISALYTTINLR